MPEGSKAGSQPIANATQTSLFPSTSQKGAFSFNPRMCRDKYKALFLWSYILCFTCHYIYLLHFITWQAQDNTV